VEAAVILDPLWPLLVGGVALLVATGVWARRAWPLVSTGGRVVVVTRMVLAVLAVAIGLHPVGALRTSPVQETTTDLVVVLDRTTSMSAQDYGGGRPRMDGAAADLAALVRANSGAEISVVVFDDDARVAVPFTTDVTTVSGFLDTVGWRPTAKASGSDVAVAVDLVGQVLHHAAADRPDHERYLVYAGDGEQTAATAPGSFESLRELVSGTLVLGYGTEAGGEMIQSVEGDEPVTLGGEVQLSRIDQARLSAIADQLGGTYAHRTGAGALPDLVPPSSRGSVSALVPGAELYWIIALVAAAALLVLLCSATTAARTAHEEVSGAA
jgi:Ca-activated chloride channel homolog